MNKQADSTISIVHHTDFLLARARRLTRRDADAHDLVQDTCVQALESLAQMSSPPSNVRAWLLVVMRNHWFNTVRHRRVCDNARAAIADQAAGDASLCETRVVYRQLERAWNGLAPQAQSIAAQCLFDGDSQEEVSRRFGMTAGGIATSIHRTREHLRRAMFDT